MGGADCVAFKTQTQTYGVVVCSGAFRLGVINKQHCSICSFVGSAVSGGVYSSAFRQAVLYLLMIWPVS